MVQAARETYGAVCGQSYAPLDGMCGGGYSSYSGKRKSSSASANTCSGPATKNGEVSMEEALPSCLPLVF